MRAQLLSFDFSTGTIFFLLMIALIIGIFAFNTFTSNRDEIPFELEFVLSNLENNVRFAPVSERFLTNYRVDKDKLDAFALSHSGSIDDFLIGTFEDSHGIGISPDNYDGCLYFRDDNGPIAINQGQPEEVVALGETKSGSCDSHIIGNQNPCSDDYSTALALFEPVLMDYHDVSENKIVQLNMVLCQI